MSDDQTSALEFLLAQARAAGPSERINWRDPIAGYGPAAIAAVEPWVADRRLGAFAVRVMEAVAKGGDRATALAGLSRSRALAGSPSIAQDIEDALARLGVPALGPSPRKPLSDPYAVYAVHSGAGWSWPGFQEHEFGRIAGTSWRSRGGATSLAPVLTRSLRHQHPHFESYAIERRPELHFAIAERYRLHGEHESGFRAAKLFVFAHGPTEEQPGMPRQVATGLYVEKGDGDRRFGPVDDDWDWPHLIAALGDPHVQGELSAAMRRHDLRIGDYLVDAGGDASTAIGAVLRLEDGRLVGRDRHGAEVGVGWSWLQDRLRALAATQWHEFFVWRAWPADEAIAAGPSFASDALLPVLTDLARVYLDVVGPLLAGWAAEG